MLTRSKAMIQCAVKEMTHVLFHWLDFSPGNLLNQCSAVTYRNHYRKTHGGCSETEENWMACDSTLRRERLKVQKGVDENFESAEANLLFFWFIYRTFSLVLSHLDSSLVSFSLYIMRWRRGCVSWLPVAGALGQSELSLELTGHQRAWTPESEPTEKQKQMTKYQLWSAEALNTL